MKYHGKEITWKRVTRRLKYELCGARLYDIADAWIDLRVCGKVINRGALSVFRNDKEGIGYTGFQHTHYAILKEIFSHVTLRGDEHFLDVGCGKGNVLAFLVKEKLLPNGKISGIEINPKTYAFTDWTRRYPQIDVQLGNALEIDYAPYDVLFLARPFLPKTFLDFLDRMESTVCHPVTFIYWVDQQSGHFLKDRKGWSMHYRGQIDRLHGIKAGFWPEGISIWTFDPNKKETE